jgi:hypothetical protein
MDEAMTLPWLIVIVLMVSFLSPSIFYAIIPDDLSGRAMRHRRHLPLAGRPICR